MKKTIAVDIDEVLARHNHTLATFHNQRYGTNHTEDDYFSDRWEEVWRVSREEAERRAVEFHAANMHATFEPVPDALPVLKTLKDYFNLEIVTVRRQSIIPATYIWLQTHFPDVFSNVHFIHFWDKGDTQTKVSVCESIGAEWLIDDSLRHAKQMAQSGRQGVLFGDYSWNQSDNLPESVVRLKNWQEVGEYFYGRRTR